MSIGNLELKKYLSLLQLHGLMSYGHDYNHDKVIMTGELKYILFIIRDSFRIDAKEPEEFLDNRIVTEIIIRNGILLTVYSSLNKVIQDSLRINYYAGLKQSILSLK